MMIVFHVPNNKSSSEEKDRHWSRLDKTKVGLKKKPWHPFLCNWSPCMRRGRSDLTASAAARRLSVCVKITRDEDI